ncbi:hypothetical protein [Hydrocarboniphaga sp.]|uniref:hypothetical protein n=1 Tax=Hydrocarboniphaga sp. TaxID=2033016 RepID=UPI003D1355F7
MRVARSHKSPAVIACAALLSMMAACSSSPKKSQGDAPLAVADSKPCKTTRNVQSPGPQPPSNPPRCANSVDAGKLPATAIGTIMISH